MTDFLCNKKFPLAILLFMVKCLGVSINYMKTFDKKIISLYNDIYISMKGGIYMSTKITSNMSTMDVIMTMSEGNPEALNVIMEMLQSPNGGMDILFLDIMNIRGSKINKLKNDCCERNDDKFNRTLMMFRTGTFTEEEIQQNFDLTYAISFIDESVNPEGTPEYGKEFGPMNLLWETYCQKQRESFLLRLAERIEQEQQFKK